MSSVSKKALFNFLSAGFQVIARIFGYCIFFIVCTLLYSSSHDMCTGKFICSTRTYVLCFVLFQIRCLVNGLEDSSLSRCLSYQTNLWVWMPFLLSNVLRPEGRPLFGNCWFHIPCLYVWLCVFLHFHAKFLAMHIWRCQRCSLWLVALVILLGAAAASAARGSLVR